jgi:hypothetical protein
MVSAPMQYHRAMVTDRERILQIARLVGHDAFVARFGPPQTADPDQAALAALIEERLGAIAEGLVAEAAVSDDVIDRAGADSYLEDRLATLDDLLTGEQAGRIRMGFAERTKAW